MWLVGLEGVSHRFLRARGRAGENEKPGHALQRPGGPGGRARPPDAVPLPEEDTRKRIVDVYKPGARPTRTASAKRAAYGPGIPGRPSIHREAPALGARSRCESRGCGTVWPPWYVRPLRARVCCS